MKLSCSLCIFITSLFMSLTTWSQAAESKKSSTNSEQALKEALARIPGQKLTLDFVMSMAIQSSDSYQALEAGRISSEATALDAESPHDWYFTGKYELMDDRRQKVTPFEPNRIDRDYWNLGVRKYFSTGTEFETTYGRSYNTLRFPASAGVSLSPYYEDGLSFNLRQNLWADFFGEATRASYSSIEQRGLAEKIQYEESVEDWSLNLISIFHNAWMTQNQFFAAQENHKRQQKLLRTTQSKLRRGTAERPDLLQVESAVLLAENSLSEAESNLQETWRRLQVILKLPEALAQVQPEKIPMVLNPAPEEAKNLCTRPTNIESTKSVRAAKNLLKASEQKYQKAVSEDKPKLQFYGNYATNGINRTSAQAQQETLDQDHPAWTMGVQLEVPFDSSITKAKRSRAQAELIQAQSTYSSALDDKKIELATLCDRLEKSKVELENAKKAFENQKQRLSLEEQRFQIGRTNTFSIIQAGDDKTRAEQIKDQAEVSYRLNAWKVLKATSEIEPYISNWKK